MQPADSANLRHHLLGSLTDALEERTVCATDASPLAVVPSAVAYPRTVADVQLLAAQGGAVSSPAGLTARGGGNNKTGAAVGAGTVVAFSAHLSTIKHIGKHSVTVEAGANLDALQQTLRTHGRWVPITAHSPSATAGGLVSMGGGTSLKYGPINRWVQSLKVVLDDGSLIETKRLSRWELNRKKGRMTREGELYRSLDGLLQDHRALVADSQPAVAINAAGYRLEAIKRRDGSFDLVQLYCGAQGTLGLIVEVTVKTLAYDPRRTVVAGYFDGWEAAGAAVLQLRKLQPSRLEAVDAASLEGVRAEMPGLATGLFPETAPAVMLLAEFDHDSHLRQNRAGRRAERLMTQLGVGCHKTQSPAEQERLWAVVAAVPVALRRQTAGAAKPLPLLEGSAVPVERLPELAVEAGRLLAKHKTGSPLWGAVGIGNLQLQPAFDLTKARGRRTAVKLASEFYSLVIKLGGTPSATESDGRWRAPYLESLYGPEMYQLLVETKRLCDPAGIFNPGVKLGVGAKSLESLMRHTNL